MNIQTVQLNTGIKLEYSLTGEQNRETLLFVHGSGSNLRQFEQQQQFFERDYRVLLVSLRGHGGSTAPPDPVPADYEVRELARDVQSLLKHLDINRVHFVGNSLGGLVGYELTDLDRDLLLSLTTFGTTPRLHTSGLGLWTLLTTIRLLGPRGMSWLVGKTASRDQTVQTELKKIYENTSKEVLILVSKNIANYDYTEYLNEPDIPMMLIKCCLDGSINKNLGAAPEIFKKNPNFTYVEITDAGHFANMDEPEEFNEIVNSFLVKQSIKNYLRPRSK